MERDAFEQDLKVLQEQFSEQSEKLNEIQEKLALYTPKNVNKGRKGPIQSLMILNPEFLNFKWKSAVFQMSFQKSRKNANKPKVKLNS